MKDDSYQIRSCPACGLRYPLLEGQAFGTRCPACLSETRLVLSRKRIVEPGRDLTQPDLTPTPSAASPKRRGGSGEIAVLLDNIRSAGNVGSILRSAEGFGFDHAYLCGITPTPENEAVTKTSLGAEDSVTWSYHKDALKLVKGLKKEGWLIWALEEDARAKQLALKIANGRIKKEERGKSVALIVGNEVTGVDPGLLDLCAEIFYIPMRGEKKSFNVAVAFGIAAYAISGSKN